MGLGLSHRRGAVLALFTISGATALAGELVWMRMLGSVVGASHAASSLVLAVFMAGLALGAVLAGPRLDRARSALGAYGRIELGIGLWTLALPLTAALVKRLYLAAQPLGPVLEAVARSLAASVLLLVPTTLMGATLPAIVKALGRDRPSRAAGEAYALNVLGAVMGALLAGLWVLPRLGVTATNTLAGAISVVVGSVALVLARREKAGAQLEPPRRRESSAKDLRLALLVAALGGASALGLEVVWLRALSILTADTLLAQTATLAGYLFGLALGGRLSAQRIERVRHAWPLLAVCQLAIAAYALASPVLLALVARELGWQSGALSGVSGQLALSAGFFVLPAALSGASLTLLFRVSVRAFDKLGVRTGRLAAANAIGATLGALAVGLVAIPRFGSQVSLVFAALLSVAAALIALTRGRGPARGKAWLEPTSYLAIGVVLALGAWLLRGDRFRLFGKPPAGTSIAFAAEDEYGLVEVRKGADGELTLVTDRKNAWGSTHPLMVDSMLEQGRLPLSLHPEPRSVIEIGLGTGVSFAPVLADAAVERAQMVEISPAVVDAARLFSAHNRRLHDHEKLELFVGDGRHHLFVSKQRYDVIVLGLFTPYRAGAGYLFSRELYRACRERLNPGGLLVHWLPLDQLSPEALASILSTFASELSVVHAFDRVQYLALVGASEPLSLDAARLTASAKRQGVELAEVERVLSSYLFGRAEVLELGQGAPLSTDDFPFVELHPPEPGMLKGRMLAVKNLERVLSVRKRPNELVRDSALLERAERAWLGRERLIRGGIAQARGDHALARRLFAEALELSPRDRLARAQLASYARR